MKKVFSLVLILTLLICIGCSMDESSEPTPFELNSQSLLEMLSDNDAITSKRPQPTVYADCNKYKGIVVPATFKNKGPFDELFMVPNGSFKNGVPLISDSKPGDQDYNGGRWHMNLLKEGVLLDKYDDACSMEDLDPEDFWSTDIYFECPLTKFKY